MSQDVAWCPKHQTAKWCCWFDGHCLKEKDNIVSFFKRKYPFFFLLPKESPKRNIQKEKIETDTYKLFIHKSYIYIYIYIYSHPQTDCFVLSELFSVARHAGRSKPESKPVQLYDRLRLQTTRPQANYVG